MTKKTHEYDIVIIGAGMGGLGAGLTLKTSEPELKIIILEQHSIPGGYVTGFKRKGIYFDAGAEGTIYAGENQVLRKYLGKLGVKQEFIRIDPLEKLVYPDNEITVHADYNKFRSELIGHYPSSKDEISEYFEIMKQMVEEFWYYGPTQIQDSIWTLIKFVLRSRTIVKNYRKTFQKFLEEKLSNKELHSILSFYNLWIGLPPKAIRAPVGVIVGGNAYIHGNYYPKGGMLGYSKNLAGTFLAKGGEIRYNSKVERILVNENKAKGVKLSSGEVLKGKVIISNADLKHTYLDLVGKANLPRRKSKKIEKLEPSLSGFAVYLGLDTHLEDHPSHITIMQNYENIIDPVINGEFSVNGVAIRIPEQIDSDLKDEKGAGIILLALAPYDWKDYWKTGKNKEKGAEYKQLKEKYAEKLIQIAEKVIPKLSEHILTKDIATPLTFERYTLNEGGGWYGPQKGQKKSKYKQIIQNLILTGANVDSVGVPTAFISGIKTARKLLKCKNRFF